MRVVKLPKSQESVLVLKKTLKDFGSLIVKEFGRLITRLPESSETYFITEYAVNFKLIDKCISPETLIKNVIAVQKFKLILLGILFFKLKFCNDEI